MGKVLSVSIGFLLKKDMTLFQYYLLFQLLSDLVTGRITFDLNRKKNRVSPRTPILKNTHFVLQLFYNMPFVYTGRKILILERME